MKKFVFSLQPVLNLREQEEKSARTELGKKTAECERIRGKMKAHIALLDRFEAPENGAVDWSAYQQTTDFIRVQNLRLKDDLSRAEERRQSALAAYREARNRKKVFEKLKERRELEFRAEMKEKENKALDDLFSSRGTYHRSLKK